ncbi:MAG: tRNA threonylcarbamoyladenosine dehydratase, partial [Myxococcales bacterium]
METRQPTETPACEPTCTPVEAPHAPKLHRRFDRTARLLGEGAMEKLARAHVVVLGMGGVGSYAA